MRDTCDYPTISNAYFTMVSEPKLSDDMKGEDFQPPEPLLDGRNIGNSVLLWYLVKSIYDRGKNFFSIFFAFLVQKIHQQISLSLMFSMFLILYYENSKTYFYTSDYIKECNVCQQLFCNIYLVMIFKLLFGGAIPPSSTSYQGFSKWSNLLFI